MTATYKTNKRPSTSPAPLSLCLLPLPHPPHTHTHLRPSNICVTRYTMCTSSLLPLKRNTPVRCACTPVTYGSPSVENQREALPELMAGMAEGGGRDSKEAAGGSSGEPKAGGGIAPCWKGVAGRVPGRGGGGGAAAPPPLPPLRGGAPPPSSSEPASARGVRGGGGGGGGGGASRSAPTAAAAGRGRPASKLQ